MSLKLNALLSSSHEYDFVRLSAVIGENSGSEWLNAVPIKSCGLLMNDTQVRINIGLRLGAQIVKQHSCISCGSMVSENGSHGLSCRSSSGRHTRHTEANNILRRAFQLAGYPSVLEPVALSRTDGKRPDGMTVVTRER